LTISAISSAVASPSSSTAPAMFSIVSALSSFAGPTIATGCATDTPITSKPACCSRAGKRGPMFGSPPRRWTVAQYSS